MDLLVTAVMVRINLVRLLAFLTLHSFPDNLITRSMSPPSVTRSGRASSPPTYSPPKRPVRMATKDGRSF
jgi:hypothetical protein